MNSVGADYAPIDRPFIKVSVEREINLTVTVVITAVEIILCSDTPPDCVFTVIQGYVLVVLMVEIRVTNGGWDASDEIKSGKNARAIKIDKNLPLFAIFTFLTQKCVQSRRYTGWLLEAI